MTGPGTAPLAEATPAERHRRIAVGFAEELARTDDLDARSPVPDWVARDVVAHLLDWLPGLLGAGGVELPPVTPQADAGVDDLATAWAARSTAVQALLEADDADRDFTNHHLGTLPLDTAIDRFYTADVFMHTWDLAQAGGRRPDLDPVFAQHLLDGMTPVEKMLRDSGQYGPAYPPPADDPVGALAAFIGRDPDFTARP